MSVLPIETARLSLRLFSNADLPVLVAILGDPEVMKLALYERPLTPSEVQEFIDAEFAKSNEEIARLAVLCRNRRATSSDSRVFSPAHTCPASWNSGSFWRARSTERDMRRRSRSS